MFKDNLRYISYGAFEGTGWLKRQPSGIVYCAKVAYTYKNDGAEHQTVSVRPGTRTIAVGCFLEVKNIREFILPESLREISEEAFEFAGIERVTVPNGVVSIKEFAFQGCRNLKECTLLGCESIGMSAFFYCDSLCHISFPENIVSIGDHAFEDCVSLKSIDIPGHLKKIPGSAFFGCNSLSLVILNEGLEEIGNDAFLNCPLESIVIPSTVERIGIMSFNQPCLLKDVIVKSVNPPSLLRSSDINPMIGEDYYSDVIRRFWECDEGRTLYVPNGSINIYRNAEGWSKFNFINEFDNK